VLALVGVGEAVVGGTDGRVSVEGARKILGLEQDARLFVELDLHFHLIAGGDTRGFAVRVAQAEQVPSAHDGHSAPPAVPVQGDFTRGRLPRLAPGAQQRVAYRRLGLAILGLDVASLTAELGSARQASLARAA
jgi:hypothetical protein